MTEPDAPAAAYRAAADSAREAIRRDAGDAAARREAVARRDVTLDVQSAERRSHADHVHTARVSAARGLVVVRRRTGRPIPAEVLELAGPGWK